MKRRECLKKKKKGAHYAGGLGLTVLAGGLWGVIRAVTAGITVVPPLLEEGEVEAGPGRGWEVLAPRQELGGPLVESG